MITIMARELEVLDEFQRPAQGVVELVRGHLGREAGDGAESFLASVICFGRAERVANSASRHRAVGLTPDFAAEQDIQKWNDKGLLRLEKATSSVRELRDTASGDVPTSQVLSEISDVFTDFKRFFANSEMKPSDVGKLAQVLDEIEVATRRGETTIAEFLSNKLGELDGARRRPDRGAVENIPIWKILAIAIFLGLAFYVIFRCLRNDAACAAAVAAAIAAGTTLEKLIALLC